MKIKRKQIAFNLDDPLQKELYEYTLRFKNFSFYGKNLIQKDMQGLNIQNNKDNYEEEEIDISNSLAKSFI